MFYQTSDVQITHSLELFKVLILHHVIFKILEIKNILTSVSQITIVCFCVHIYFKTLNVENSPFFLFFPF